MELPKDGYGRTVHMLDKASAKDRDAFVVVGPDGSVQFCLDWPAGARTAAQVYESIHKAAPGDWDGTPAKSVDAVLADAAIAKVRKAAK